MSETIPSSETPLPPSTFDPGLFPKFHRPLWQWLLDHNPCLLLSTVLMLLGCYLINTTLQGHSDNAKLVGLLAVMNVYEACIIPLGLVLIRRTRGTARDGWWLLLFETLFLVNGSFINVDFGPKWGIPFNLVLLVLALVKAGVILQGLKIGLSLRTFGFFAVQLGLIYAMPILFALVNVDGVVSQRVMYGLWWLVGLLPVAYDQIARHDERRHPVAGAPPRWDLVQQVIRRVYLIVPFVMLVAHLRFSHWAHHADFRFADLSPVLLGLTVASLRVPLPRELRLWARAMPVVAFMLAFAAGSELWWSFTLGDVHHTLVPAHATIAGVVLTYGYLAGTLAFVSCAASLVLAAIGYACQTWITAALRAAARFLIDMFPTTTYGWGVAAIAGAFTLLGVGSMLGLRRTAAKAIAPL